MKKLFGIALIVALGLPVMFSTTPVYSASVVSNDPRNVEDPPDEDPDPGFTFFSVAVSSFAGATGGALGGAAGGAVVGGPAGAIAGSVGGYVVGGVAGAVGNVVTQLAGSGGSGAVTTPTTVLD